MSKEGKHAKKESAIGGCERCGKMVVLTKFTLCYDCRKQEKEEVDKALDFLKTHRGATLQMVADATGVDPKLVLRLIRGGRVEARAQENIKKKREQ